MTLSFIYCFSPIYLCTSATSQYQHAPNITFRSRSPHNALRSPSKKHLSIVAVESSPTYKSSCLIPRLYYSCYVYMPLLCLTVPQHMYNHVYLLVLHQAYFGTLHNTFLSRFFLGDTTVSVPAETGPHVLATISTLGNCRLWLHVTQFPNQLC